MNLTWLYNFMQVLNIKRSYSTKYDYFSKHIPFNAIYFL
jgi:hypothetical protein